MKVAAIYVRISNDPLGVRAGVERQLADCAAIVEARGWGSHEVYEDNDRSAWSGKRPAFERMLKDIKVGRIGAVVAWDMDRLVRQPRDLELFLDTCHDARLRKVTTAQGDIDLTSNDGQLHARILAAVAKKESDDKSRRVKRALTSKGEKGEWRGGRPPWGYRAEGTTLVQTDDAHHVAEAALALIEGETLRSIQRRFLDVGGPTSHPGWRSLLLSPTIAGITHTGHTASWEPIIEPATAAQVKAILADPRRTTHTGTQRQHWLSGLVFCGRCNGPMRHNFRNRKGVDYSRYVCSSCRGVSIVASPLEAFVEGAIFSAAPTVGAPNSPEPHPPRRGDGVPLGVLQERLDKLVKMYMAGTITESEWVTARESLTEMTPEPAAPAPHHEPVTESAWASWSPSERRRAAGWLIDRVVVHPGTVTVADRVEFIWLR